MLAKQIALGFGIAVLFPMMIHYGVATIYPVPNWNNFMENQNNRTREAIRATPEERDKIGREIQQSYKEGYKEHKEKEQRFARSLFYVGIPIGIIAMIVGSVLQIQSVGTGLMFAGILTLMDSYYRYWSDLQDWMKFISLLIAVIVLFFIGYRKLSPNLRTRSN
jgi:ATP-dependent exoDNAse (exonuclease V) alpha subunit